MKALFLTKCAMDMEFIGMLMVIVMKVNGKMMNSLEVVLTTLLMVVNIKDAGDKVVQMEKEPLYMIAVKVLTLSYILVDGSLENIMEKEGLFTLMMMCMKEILLKVLEKEKEIIDADQYQDTEFKDDKNHEEKYYDVDEGEEHQ